MKEESWTYCVLKALMEKYNFDLDTPYKDLPKKVQEVLMYGEPEKLKVTYTKRKCNGCI